MDKMRSTTPDGPPPYPDLHGADLQEHAGRRAVNPDRHVRAKDEGDFKILTSLIEKYKITQPARVDFELRIAEERVEEFSRESERTTFGPRKKGYADLAQQYRDLLATHNWWGKRRAAYLKRVRH